MTAAAPSGLREDKKRRTRERIRSAAMALFSERGYRQTTLENIAAAADVAPRTLYLYFPSKESLVITDEDDDTALDAFREQLTLHPPVVALRHVFRAMLLDDETDLDRQRRALISAEPELQASLLSLVIGLAERCAEAIVEHTGRPDQLPAARSLAGAAAGIALITVRWDTAETRAQQLENFEAGLTALGRGFTLN